MAESQAKRHRDVEQVVENIEVAETKRHKSSYNQILASFLDEEEEVSSQDLSALLTTLQQELLDPLPCPNSEPDPNLQVDSTVPDCSTSPNTSEEDEKEKVIRHLLEASDDELGIPNRVEMESSDEDLKDLINHNNPFSICDGLWELEDEAANYYTLLQSQLFM